MYIHLHTTPRKFIATQGTYILSYMCELKPFGLPLVRSTAKDCGGFLEASVAGESPHHRDDHQPGGGD